MERSFRQVGRQSIGRIVKGKIVPSPPSELLVGEGVNSNPGRLFNSKSGKLPGPGVYSIPLLEINRSSSKKGSGNFASKSPRFRKFQYNTFAPGPGAYNPSVNPKSPRLALSTDPRFPVILETPAPGLYDPKRIEGSSSVSSIFKSKVKRLPAESNENPAPWHYSPKLPIPTVQSGTSVFKIPIYTKIAHNLYDPHAEIPDDTGPGPGYYEIQGISKLSVTSMFKNKAVRFGSKDPPAPSPFDYNTELPHEVGNINAFVSKLKKNALKSKTRPPGPAFYKPIFATKRTSFHINTHKDWV